MEGKNIKNKILENIYLSQEEKIDELIKNTNAIVKNKLNKIEKEIYKQGFADGVNLLRECIDK